MYENVEISDLRFLEPRTSTETNTNLLEALRESKTTETKFCYTFCAGCTLRNFEAVAGEYPHICRFSESNPILRLLYYATT